MIADTFHKAGEPSRELILQARGENYTSSTHVANTEHRTICGGVGFVNISILIFILGRPRSRRCRLSKRRTRILLAVCAHNSCCCVHVDVLQTDPRSGVGTSPTDQRHVGERHLLRLPHTRTGHVPILLVKGSCYNDCQRGQQAAGLEQGALSQLYTTSERGKWF